MKQDIKPIVNQDTNNNAIVVNNLCLYRNFHSKCILDHVSFKIPMGSFAVFVGANGAGKTTTIKSMLNIFNYDSGTIQLLGTNISNPLSRKEVSYVPEKENFTKCTLLHFLTRMGRLNVLPKNIIQERIDKYTKLFTINNLLEQNINSMSTGQKKKVLLVSALLNEPKLIIMDEPTSNLDPESRFDFYKIVEQLNKQYKTTFFISSHNLEELGEHCNYCVFIGKGKILYEGHISSKTDLIEKYKKSINYQNE